MAESRLLRRDFVLTAAVGDFARDCIIRKVRIEWEGACLEAFIFVCRNLQLLREAGAEVVFFSPLTGSLPEGISGIYLGGGYPELHAADLSSRRDLRAAVKAFAEAGGVVYAECGGLLYLSQSIQPLNRMPSSMGRPPISALRICFPDASGYFKLRQSKFGESNILIGTSNLQKPYHKQVECPQTNSSIVCSGHLPVPYTHDSKRYEDGVCGGLHQEVLLPLPCRRDCARACLPFQRDLTGDQFICLYAALVES